MNDQNRTSDTSRKLKKLIVASALICYVPLTSGCAQYVMLALSMVSMISNTVANHRQQEGRREAWQKGEPYIEDAATTNWKTASNVGALGAMFTSFGHQAGWWNASPSAGNQQQASEWVNPDTGQVYKPNQQQAGVGGGGQKTPEQVITTGKKTEEDLQPQGQGSGQTVTNNGTTVTNNYYYGNVYNGQETSHPAHSGTVVDPATVSSGSSSVEIKAGTTKIKHITAENTKVKVLSGSSKNPPAGSFEEAVAIENANGTGGAGITAEVSTSSTKNRALSGRNARNKNK